MSTQLDRLHTRTSPSPNLNNLTLNCSREICRPIMASASAFSELDSAVESAIEAYRAEQQPARARDKTKTTTASSSDSQSLAEEERREKIRVGLLKKKCCEKRALKWVEQLLEGPVEREVLRRALSGLTPGYYADVTEERFCVKLCGYPLCARTLQYIPRQKYRISLKDKKVYDLSERKKFCSDFCYTASNFYLSQVPSSPLWLRESENMTATPVRFYDEVQEGSNKLGEKGALIEISNKDSQEKTTSVIEQDELVGKNQPNIDESQATKDGAGIEQKLENLAIADQHQPATPINQDGERSPTQKPPLPATAESPTATALSSTTKSKPRRPKQPAPSEPVVPPLQKVESCLREWYTLDTLRFLQGDDHVRQMLLANDCTVDNVVAAVGDEKMRPELREKYIRLCRNLNLRELEEKLGDNAVANGNVIAASASGSANRPKKPLPSYEKLQSESREQQLKIEAFLQGKTAFAKDKDADADADADGGVEPVLPLLDKHAQMMLRRRIVHEQLDRVFPDILKLCGIAKRDVSSLVRKLVQSFSLSATNIILKPDEWTLLAVIVIKMVAPLDYLVLESVDKASSTKYLNLLLLAYGTDLASLDRLIAWLPSDISGLVGKLA